MPESIESQTPVQIQHKWVNYNFDPGAFRKPDYQVYIYSISNKEFTVRRPPQFPIITIHACPEDKEYVTAVILDHPFQQLDLDVDTGEPRMRYHKAEAIAQDIVCPDAPNMDTPLPIDCLSSGTDYRVQGVFWSRNNPPTAEEIKKAHQRREKYYRGLLEKATALEYSDPKTLHAILNEDYHLAADYFDEEYSWHKKRVKKVTTVAKSDCPNCGNEIKPGIAFHFDPDTGLCVLDWKRAYEAGKVKLEDVPESKRWETPVVKESKPVKA
jgi:hypothetical protein